MTKKTNTMELSDFDTTVSNLNVYQGDTIEDVMNIPFTTVVDTSIQDFGTLYPHDQAELSEDEQMSKYRRLMEEKSNPNWWQQQKQLSCIQLKIATKMVEVTSKPLMIHPRLKKLVCVHTKMNNC